MDPKLAEIRRQAALRYRETPAGEKPQLRLCEQCGQSVYDHTVCQETGRVHDIGKKTVVGGAVLDAEKKVVTSRELMAAIDGIRVKWQAARTQKMRVDEDSIGIFQTLTLSRQWKLMRCGIMYGHYDKTTATVSVHSIYEPEQSGTPTDWTLLPDPRTKRVDKLASLLGLQRVGLAITHPARDQSELILTGKELLALAKEQSIFGDHCVILAIAPDITTGHITASAWQASEQCVHLFQIGFLSENKEDIRTVASTQPLEIAQEETDKKGHKQCIVKEPASIVDTRWMTAYIAVEKFHSTVIRNTFARISRPGEAPPGMPNLAAYLKDAKRAKLPFVQKIDDFHVLIFLMETIFDISQPEIALIAEGVLKKDNEQVKVYEDLLASYLR